MVNTKLPDTPAYAAATALTDALALLRADGAMPPREAVLGAFRRHLSRIRQAVRDDFETYRMAGVEAAQRLAGLTDGVVRTLFDHAVAATTAAAGLPDRVAIVATGGYGRRMLAPFSDIDLLFLAPDDPSPETLRVIEYMLYFMWDLGLKVGHATRSIAHCLTDAGTDLTIRTSLLDARLLAGDAALFDEFHSRFEAASIEAGAAAFIMGKQTERAERHRRFGESAFLVEPNIKEGRGGLRDLQTLYCAAHGTSCGRSAFICTTSAAARKTA
jgi:[protein-PII] uridylyltransferase